MASGVVLDTSFLITLADAARDNHATARSYWKHFTENRIPMFLPTIVASEFCVKQPLPPEILKACVVLPFNWDDAMKTSKLELPAIRKEGDTRVSLKDDIKIIAQAIVKDAAYLITDDKNSFFRYAEHLNQSGQATFKPIRLAEGFDRAHFRPDGQRDFEDALMGSDTAN
jgi:hypothetical protein